MFPPHVPSVKPTQIKTNLLLRCVSKNCFYWLLPRGQSERSTERQTRLHVWINRVSAQSTTRVVQGPWDHCSVGRTVSAHFTFLSFYGKAHSVQSVQCQLIFIQNNFSNEGMLPLCNVAEWVTTKCFCSRFLCNSLEIPSNPWLNLSKTHADIHVWTRHTFHGRRGGITCTRSRTSCCVRIVRSRH